MARITSDGLTDRAPRQVTMSTKFNTAHGATLEDWKLNKPKITIPAGDWGHRHCWWSMNATQTTAKYGLPPRAAALLTSGVPPPQTRSASRTAPATTARPRSAR